MNPRGGLPHARPYTPIHRFTVRSLAALIGLTLGAVAVAQPAAPRHGDHPAVVVQRLHAQQGYDYAAQFYPHPAWLYLLPDATRPMNEHPAVIVFRREQQRQQALAQAEARAQAAGAALMSQTTPAPDAQ